MKKYKVKKKPAIILSENDEIEITKYISEVIFADNIKIICYNICGDHVHLILFCNEQERDKIVGKLKSVSSRKYNIAHNLTTIRDQEQGGMPPCSGSRGKTQNNLWAQKYNWSYILNDEALGNTYNYIIHNRIKHNLPSNKKLQEVIDSMITPFDQIIQANDTSNRTSLPSSS